MDRDVRCARRERLQTTVWLAVLCFSACVSGRTPLNRPATDASAEIEARDARGADDPRDSATGADTRAGSGNSTVICPGPGFSTSIPPSSDGMGPITGWGWVALGALDVITDPTCAGVPITKAKPCLTSTYWNSSTALCVSGSIPALPAAPVQSDYDNNWGIALGVNANPDDTMPIGEAYSTIAVSVTGTPTVGLRVILHRLGDPEDVTYCARYTGATMKLTSFNTRCWDNSGVFFTAPDAPKIDKVGVQVSSTFSAITVTNLCLNCIIFGK